MSGNLFSVAKEVYALALCKFTLMVTDATSVGIIGAIVYILSTWLYNKNNFMLF